MASRNTAAAFLGGSRIHNYKPSLHGWNWGLWQSGQRGFYIQDVELMRRDPQIIFGTWILTAPLFRMHWQVKGPNEELNLFVDKTLKQFWMRDLVHVLRMNAWGFMGGEPMYKVNPQTEQIEYDRLRDYYPLDLIPLETGGRLTGIKVKGTSEEEGAGDERPALRTPRMFWSALDPEYGSLFGRSRYAGAWAPWQEKTGRHGALDARRLWYLKNAFRGGTIRHPPGMIELGNGAAQSCQDYARELLEKFETGGILVLPNTRDDASGEFLWQYDPPAVNGDLKDIREYPKDLDTEMLKGMTIPPEVIQASSAGSGWSGRSVPFLVFLTGRDQDAFTVLHSFNLGIGKPLAWQNFATDNYEIVPESLTYLAGDDPGQGKKPEQPAEVTTQPPTQPRPTPQPKPPIQLSQGIHAPKGGVTVAGTHYPGGQFIPGEAVKAASPKERDTLERALAKDIRDNPRPIPPPRELTDEEKAANKRYARADALDKITEEHAEAILSHWHDLPAAVIDLPDGDYVNNLIEWVGSPDVNLGPRARMAEAKLLATKAYGLSVRIANGGEIDEEEREQAVTTLRAIALEAQKVRAKLTEALAKQPKKKVDLSQGPAISDDLRQKVKAQARRKFPVKNAEGKR